MRLPVWSVWQDVRFGARVLMRDRGFTLAAVLLLGLGLGVNTTVFTIVNAMNLRGLPVERPDQILKINSRELVGQQREIVHVTRGLPRLAARHAHVRRPRRVYGRDHDDRRRGSGRGTARGIVRHG